MRRSPTYGAALGGVVIALCVCLTSADGITGDDRRPDGVDPSIAKAEYDKINPEIVGNAPYGSYVAVPDPICPSGRRYDRFFYGSTAPNYYVQATDPTSNTCDRTAERGEDDEGALAHYRWTTWFKHHPNEGERCDEQFDRDGNSLGSIPQPAGTINPDDGTPITSLFVCHITYSYMGYEEVIYSDGGGSMGHPHVGSYARPGDVRRVNMHALWGFQSIHTWGCGWVGVLDSVCKDAEGEPTAVECDGECLETHGCTFVGEPKHKSLDFYEMAVEASIDPTHGHPPDIYVFKPDPMEPDGFPVESSHTARPWLTDSEIETRINAHWHPYLPVAMKYADFFDGTMLQTSGDILMGLSSDNLSQTVSGLPVATYLVFDDNAQLPITALTTWGSGAFRPEDKLSTFTHRMTNGGGTWVMIGVDDCGADTGFGSQITSWQLHFVCVEAGPCKPGSVPEEVTPDSETPSPPAPLEGPITDGYYSLPDAGEETYAPTSSLGGQNREGSGSGDPHMVGFRGQHFDYFGLPGAVFNVITTKDTFINAALAPDSLDGLTYMRAIALQSSSGARVQVSAIDGTMLVEVGGEAVTEDRILDDVKVTFVDSTTVHVVSRQINLTMHLHKQYFLDISAVQLRENFGAGEIHGVLGNTVNLSPEFDIEGEETDYIVNGLWSTEHKHNLYQRNVTPSILNSIGAHMFEAVKHMEQDSRMLVAKMVKGK